MPSVRVRVPATSANLGPGFDALGMALDLGLALEARTDDRDSFEGLGLAAGLQAADNLVFEAADALYAAIGQVRPPLALRCDSGIPQARGLGSSAAAICAGLLAADAMARAQLSADALLDLACELEGHPDNVAPALLGGVTVAVGLDRGVRAVRLRIEPTLVQTLGLVVAIPPFPLATAKARAALPQAVTHRDAAFNVGRSALLVAALTGGELAQLADALDDRLHEPYRRPLIAGYHEVVAAARAAGALAVTLSGSGPTLLAWCPRQASRAVGEAMQAAWGPQADVREVAIADAGARVERAYRS